MQSYLGETKFKYRVNNLGKQTQITFTLSTLTIN